MKKLTPRESDRLAALLKRAIANNQFYLTAAAPYKNEADWKRDGWAFNDTHSGNSTAGHEWNVEVCHEVADGLGGTPCSEVAVYVDDESLCFLACSMGSRELDRALTVAKKATAKKGAGKRR